MCAICGVATTGKPVDQNLLRQMTRLMSYRGPDDEGFYVGEAVGLGHRRLAIIDLETGHQPLSNEEQTVFLVINGEIYNYRHLRTELEGRGHRFATSSDSEVCVHLYEEKGVGFLTDLRGQFALALWDAREKTLLLARDRIGKKPLVYAELPGEIVFASEIKAILLHPDIRREIDPASLDLFLTFQAVPSPHSIFKDIRKIPPAHYLVWRNGASRIARYWDVDFTRKLRLKTTADYAELLWTELTESVRLRMISDVPLGAFLSGGIDSSTVVGIMSTLSPSPVKTFSIGFEERDYTELTYARRVAERFGADHHEFIVRPDVISILPALVWHYNEPFGDPSMVPTYYVARETRRHVTVALNGDGGDENLAGYTRYWQTLLMHRLLLTLRRMPAQMRRRLLALFEEFRGPGSHGALVRLGKWMHEADTHGVPFAYLRRLVCFSDEYKKTLYGPAMKEQAGHACVHRISRCLWEQAGDVSLLEKMLFCDFRLYLPEVLTVKMDIATMAHGLEARSPFLDHRFVETVASFPAALKLRGLTTKYVLKQKLRGFLPDAVLRRHKMGFGMPLGEWFRTGLSAYLADILLSDRARRRPFFAHATVRRMVEEHTSRRADHSHRLWILLNFELWYRMFIEHERF